MVKKKSAPHARGGGVSGKVGQWFKGNYTVTNTDIEMNSLQIITFLRAFKKNQLPLERHGV